MPGLQRAEACCVPAHGGSGSEMYESKAWYVAAFRRAETSSYYSKSASAYSLKQRLATLSGFLAARAELVRPVANAHLLPARNNICKFPRRAHRLVSSRTLGDYSPEAKAIFLRPPCSSQRAGCLCAPQAFTRSAPTTFASQKTPPQQALSGDPNRRPLPRCLYHRSRRSSSRPSPFCNAPRS